MKLSQIKYGGNKNNYDICLDCQIGNDEIVKIICNYVKNKMKN